MPRLESAESRYLLTGSQMRVRCRELLAERGEPDGNLFACHAVPGTSPLADIGRTLEREVFEERFGNDASVMASEYGPYEDHSLFFVVVCRQTHMPVGVLRVIEPSDAGLKSITDLAATPLRITPQQFLEAYRTDLSRCWDVGTVAVAARYRGRRHSFLISALLYRAMYVTATRQGMEYLVAIVDRRAHRNLDLLGIPFEPILDSGPFEYLDSDHSTALVGRIDRFPAVMTGYADRVREAAQAVGDADRLALAALVLALRDGTGLDVMIRLPDTDDPDSSSYARPRSNTPSDRR